MFHKNYGIVKLIFFVANNVYSDSVEDLINYPNSSIYIGMKY